MTSSFASAYAIEQVPLATAEALAASLQPTTRYEFWDGPNVLGHLYTEAEPDRDAYLAAVTDARSAKVSLPIKALDVPKSVSVVICTRNRPRDLARCLASLKTQTRPPDEVVVVDNGSATDETRQAALAAGVRYVREDRAGLDYARNAGVANAQYEIVAFTDDDVKLHDTWCERMLAAFDAPHVQAVTGLVLPGELTTPAQVLFEREWGFGRGYRRIDFSPEVLDNASPGLFPSWSVGAGASMAFRQEVFEVCGDFDIRLDVGAAGCSGDSEMWYRVLHHGGTCRYDPQVIAWHYHRTEEAALKKQIRAYMSGNVASVFVQLERTQRPENRRYLAKAMPMHVVRLIKQGLLKPQDANFVTLMPVIRGVVDGYIFYARNAGKAAPSNRRFI